MTAPQMTDEELYKLIAWLEDQLVNTNIEMSNTRDDDEMHNYWCGQHYAYNETLLRIQQGKPQ